MSFLYGKRADTMSSYMKYSGQNMEPQKPRARSKNWRAIMGLEDEFDFGKHKGKQLEDVIEDHPGYIEWLCKSEVVEFDEETLELISKKGIA